MKLLLSLIALFTTIIISIANGMVFVALWNWFIVPVFHTPIITVVQALGIILLFGFLTKEFKYDNTEKDNEQLFKEGLALILRPLVVLGLGFTIKLFL
jgi:hypothetical protein